MYEYKTEWCTSHSETLYERDRNRCTKRSEISNQGRLDFPEDEKNELLKLIKSKPTITVITMERPPVIPDINAKSKALIADFNSQDDIILELIFGNFNPAGRLPFEIPSSVEAVENQKEDVPFDSENPLYPFGYGITYN